MLESLLNFKKLNKNPYFIFAWSFIITNVSIVFSMLTTSNVQINNITINLSGVFAVALAIIPSTFFLKYLIEKEVKASSKWTWFHKPGFYKKYKKDMMTFLLFFLGVTYAFAIWSFVLPPDYFMPQLSVIYGIKGMIVNKGDTELVGILTNNIGVTSLSFIFSLIYGVGAIFIIIWNASLLGVCIGQISKSLVEMPVLFLQFLPHGIPEICGYLCAGLAGGILSAAIARGNKFNINLIADSLKLFVLGMLFVIVGAFIEVYFPVW